MPRMARVRSRTGIYHIMWRGANGQEIFHDDWDRRKFLDIVLKYKEEADVTVFAWCLMGNHVHLLLREGKEDISATMKRIGISYVSYYHWKYMTRGPLFQDRFNSEKVERVEYFRTVVRYIHQNPVKAALVPRVDEWKWSSCLGYYGEHVYPEGMLDVMPVLRMFASDPNFDKEMDLETARRAFKEFNEEKFSGECLDEHVFLWRLSDDQAREEIKKLLGDTLEITHVKSLPGVRRKVVLQKVKKIKGLSQRQAARILGISQNLIFKA